MAFLLRLKAWGWQLGAVVLAILAVVGRMQTLKYQRNRARIKAAIAEARVEIHKTEKRIKKKRKEDLSSSLKEEEKILKEKRFEDSDLVNPNDWD